MDYVMGIFFLGVTVTLVVGKGLLMAKDFATSEADPDDASKLPKKPAD